MESYGSVSSVILPGDNYYSAARHSTAATFMSGRPTPSDGGLTVTGPADDGTGTVIGLAPYQNDVTLSNSISVPFEGLHLNYSDRPTP